MVKADCSESSYDFEIELDVDHGSENDKAKASQHLRGFKRIVERVQRSKQLFLKLRSQLIFNDSPRRREHLTPRISVLDVVVRLPADRIEG